MAKNKQEKQTKAEKTNIAAAVNTNFPTRGRVFEGKITKIFPTRVAVEFERVVSVQKYERFYKKKTRIHARIPAGMVLALGDYVRVKECRPLSKIIHFMVIEKINSTTEEKK